MAEEILFEVDREIWSKGDGEDRFAIISGFHVEADRRSIVVKGNCPEGDMTHGLTYRLWGKRDSHDKYGEQFVFSTFLLAQPHGRRGIVRYLMQAPGIGESSATALYDLYGSDAVKALRENPSECASRVSRLGSKLAHKASAWLREQAVVESVYIDLYNLLDGRGFPKTVYRQAIERWGNRAAEVIRKNPYILHLLRFPGVGFLKADKLYKELGHNPNRLKRQTLCAHYSIASDQQGHTWFPAGRLKTALRENIDSAEIRPLQALKLGIKTKLLAIHKDEDGELWVADARKARNERDIARCIFDRSDDSAYPWPDLSDSIRLSPHQREQAEIAMRGPVALLGGTPGTGKTFTAAAIIREWGRKYGLSSIAVMAPTGKAAVRLTETMNKAGLPLRARTIHSTLGFDWSQDGGGFLHGRDNPLPESLLVVDERSMEDTDLAASVFRAFGPESRMLSIGDIYQLPPVGHGAPLRDMIKAGLPYGELSQIWRNSGRIVKACKRIKEQGEPEFSPRLDLAAEDPENLLLVEKWRPQDQIAQLESLLNRIHAGGKFHAIWDAQVICAVNRKSELSRRMLNQRLQGLLNPNGATSGDNPFRVGDKVINTKNGWITAENEDDIEPGLLRDGKVYVANGEIGKVLDVQPRYTIIEVKSPDRIVRVPRGKAQEEDEESDDSTGTGCLWDLAYAVSGHKMQGSQAPIIAMMIDEGHGAMRVMSREWIYTGISRAEKMCVCIGRKRTILECCRQSALQDRKTFLVERLQEARERHAIAA